MSSNVGYATLNVIPSAKNFGKTLSGQVNPAMSAAGLAGGGVIGATVGKIAGPLLAAAGAASMGLFVANAIKQAGAFEQSVGAIDVVFRDSASQMHEWSKGAATSVGLAKNEYNELAVLLGSQLKNAGTPMDELAGKTNNLVAAGADMASMFGGTTREAVEAISSALKGERDPIERYGVSLNEAKIQARMAEDAMNGMTFASEEQAKAAATLGLIMEQTADAQGNFARESNTYEGVMQRLSASWQNVTTTVGQGFLPIATAAGSILLGMMPGIQGVADRFAALAPAVQGVIEILLFGNYDGGLFAAFEGMSEDSGIVDFLFDIRDGVMDLWSAMAAGSPAGVAEVFTGLINGAAGMRDSLIATVLGALPGIVQSILTMAPAILQAGITSFSGLVQGLITAVPPLLAALLGLVPQLVTLLLGMVPVLLTAALTLFSSLVSAVVVAIPQIVMAIVGLLPIIATTFVTMLPGLVAAGLQLFMGIVQALVLLVPLIISALVALIPQIATALIGMLPGIVEAGLQLFMGLIQAVVEIVPVLIAAVLELLPVLITTLLGMLPSIIQSALTLFLGVVTAVLTAIPQIVVALLGMLPQLLVTIIGMIPQLIQAAVQLFTGIVQALPKVLPLIIDALVQIGPTLVSTLIGMVPLLISAGVNLIGGLVSGLWQAAGSVASALLDIVGGAVDGFLSFLGIHSPSRLFMGYGKNVGQGLAIGLDGMRRDVGRSALGLAEAAADAVSGSSLLLGADVSGSVPEGGLTGALARNADASERLVLNYTQNGGQGLTSEQELVRAARRLKYAA
ncbi:tail length tape measure protein [Microbacterium phage phiMiGM15]